jgi:hypothetical protein
VKKARLFKYAAFAFLSLLIFFILLLGVIIYKFPKEKVLSFIDTKAEAILNRRIDITDISYTLNGIRLYNIIVYEKLSKDNNPDKPEIFTSIKDASISFSLLPLIQKKIIINKIQINNFKINILFDKEKSNISLLLNDLKQVNDIGDSGFKLKISSIELKKSEIVLTNVPDYLLPLKGSYLADCIIYFNDKNKFLLTDVDITLPEERGKIWSNDIRLSFSENDFEFTGDLKLDSVSLLWIYKWTDDSSNLPYTDFTGMINRLKITSNMIEGFVSGSSMLTSKKRLNADGQCRIDLNKETVTLLNVDGNIEGSKSFINELVFSYSGKTNNSILFFKITDINADVNNFRPILTFIPKDLSGRISGDISFDNNLYNGLLKLNNVTYGNKQLFRISAEVPIKNNVIQVEKIPAFFYDQPCIISISTAIDRMDKIILNIHFNEFNLKLSDDVKEKQDLDFSNVDTKTEVTGRLEIGNLIVDKFNFSNVFINYSFNEKVLKLNKIDCNLLGGNIKADGFINLSGKEPYVRGSANFFGIKVHNVANLYEDFSNRFFGSAQGNADFEFSLKDGTSIYDSLRGRIEINIDKGKIVNTGIQKGLSVFLTELEFKLKDIEFNKIYGNIDVLGNTLNFKSMIFNSPDIRLKMTGNLDMPEKNAGKNIPGDLKMQLEFSDFFIQDIPIQVLARIYKIPGLIKKGEWYTMLFQDKGNDIMNSKNIKVLNNN